MTKVGLDAIGTSTTLESNKSLSALSGPHSLHLAYTALLLRSIRWAGILPGVHFEDVVMDQMSNFLIGHA
jgi:hypothetical protein